jgi:hypothetical protein
MAYTAMNGTVSTVNAATAIISDPYLPEVTRLVLKLQSLEKGSAGTGGSTGKGVGLRNVVGPLRLFVKTQESPWILPVAAIGVFGLIFSAGYFARKVQRG